MEKETKKIKLYIFKNSLNDIRGVGEGIYGLIGEDGKFLYSHFCSHIGYAKHDLIDPEWRKGRVEELNEIYGKGNWEVLYLKNCPEVDFDKIIELNKQGEENA